MRRLLGSLLPIILLAAALPAPAAAAQAVTVTLLPTEDVYIDAGSPQSNYGVNPNLFLILGNPPSRTRMLLNFDWSQIPEGSTISAATLQLSIMSREGDSLQAMIPSRLTEAWEEFGATWNTQPAATSTRPEILFNNDPGTKTFNVTDLVAEMLADRAGAHGIRLGGRETGSAFRLGFGGRESAQPPTLAVTYVPQVDTTGPVISAQRVENVNLTSAELACATDEDATVTVDLGLDTTYGRSISATSTARSHRVLLFPLASNSQYHYRIRARDAAGNESVSADATFTTPESSGALPAGALVKIPDDHNPETQADSAVYYVGSDGKRHPFPTPSIYRSWYADFSSVQTITIGQMAAIPLGANVRYRPGTRLVKFTTVNTVYAISLGGGLRALPNEQIAAEIFGGQWTTLVDDLSDVLFGNYLFGAPISSASDYSPTAERDAAPTIDRDQGRA